MEIKSMVKEPRLKVDAKIPEIAIRLDKMRF
jgi:hypothetical protein